MSFATYRMYLENLDEEEREEFQSKMDPVFAKRLAQKKRDDLFQSFGGSSKPDDVS